MKRIAAAIAVLALIACLATAFSAGTSSDPLISLSYINDTFSPSFLADIKSAAEENFASSVSNAEAELEKLSGKYVLTPPGYTFSVGDHPIEAKAGAVLSLAPGTSAVVDNGAAKLEVSSGEVIDLSAGEIVESGTLIRKSIRLFTTEEATATLTVYSDSALLLVDGSFSFTQGNGTAPGPYFPDIPDGHWATDYIYALAEMKLVNGTGTNRFEPEATMTRAMFVTVIGRASGIEPEDYSVSDFSDVDIGEWYGPYVAWAAESGIVNGVGGNLFAPDDPITREQMAVIIMRYAEHEGSELESTNPAADFTDAELIDDWAAEAVGLAQRAGLITGKEGGRFDPLGTATRSEVCTVIYRLISR